MQKKITNFKQKTQITYSIQKHTALFNGVD